jgi:glycogen(starch) synthase
MVVSNLYPPNHLGGYELGCQQIVDRLRELGHRVLVLTSTHGGDPPAGEVDIVRGLSFRPPAAETCTPGRLLMREIHDARVTRDAVAGFAPEIVVVFSLYGVPHGILRQLERTRIPVAYAFSAEWLAPDFANDPWLGFWRRRASTRPKRFAKAILDRLAASVAWTGSGTLDLETSFFTSRRLRELFLEKGMPVESGKVMYWGVDPERFHPREHGRLDWGPRLLVAGRMVPEKGIHTVIETMRILVRDDDVGSLTCTVAGPTQDSSYFDQLRNQVARWNLGAHISFAGEVTWSAMPGLYREHDVFLLPSVWEEPFSIGLLEAMATGLVVIATATGGTPEVLRDGENGLFFEAGSAGDLAAKVQRLNESESLRLHLASAARQTVVDGFSIERMTGDVETFLKEAISRRATV